MCVAYIPKARAALATSSNSKKPNPRLRPVSLSSSTLMLLIFPNCAKYSCNEFKSWQSLRPPRNILLVLMSSIWPAPLLNSWRGKARLVSTVLKFIHTLIYIYFYNILNLLRVNNMGTSTLHPFNWLLVNVGYKSKAPGTIRNWIAHYNSIS